MDGPREEKDGVVIEYLKLLPAILGAWAGLQSSRRRLKDYRSEKKKRESLEQHRAIAAVYPILQETLNKFDEIDRVTVFRSHNGDGIPRVGCPSHTSCIQEVLTDRTTPITERWQGIPSDQLMIAVIGDVTSDGSALLPVSSEDCPTGILTDFCRGNSIKNVLAVPIAYQDNGFIFLNFCSATCEDMSRVSGILFEAKSCASRVKEIIDSI